jgi:hypothetical protein
MVPIMVIPRPVSELKTGQEACREALEPLNGLNDLNAFHLTIACCLFVKERTLV